MKKIFRIMLGMVAALMATSCSDTSELPDAPVNPGEGGDGVYMSVTVQMPTASGGSRSETTNNGQSTDKTENGKDYENKVTAIAVVLAKPDNNGFITWGHVDANNLNAKSEKLYQATAKISKTQLQEYYKTISGSNDVLVNVFVFCNPTNDLETALESATYGSTGWLDTQCEVIENNTTNTRQNTSIWSQDYFLMNNQFITERQLPKSIEDWTNYPETKPFNLSGINNEGASNEINNGTSTRGAIKVERSVARFDFKDASGNNNTYPVVYDSDVEKENKTVFFNVQLNRMALVNMAQKFYYLHRVSDDGTPQGAHFALCGNEHDLGDNDVNYVVGPNWETFRDYLFHPVNGGEPTFKFSDYFNYPYFNNDGSIDNTKASSDKWGTSLIADVLKKTEKDQNNTYTIWRYVTEHVLPEASQQKNGISTGIVFKGKILATDEALNASDEFPGVKELAEYIRSENGKTLTGNPSEDPILYSFNGKLYFRFNSLYDAAIATAVILNDDKEVTDIKTNLAIFKAVFGNGGLGSEIEYPYNSGKKIQIPTALQKDMATDCAFAKWKEWYADSTNDTKLGAMRKAVTGAGITIYQSSNDAQDGPGYYCYYPYWNRHNDNGRPATMGPMEFGVVRNNVYKLSVTKISRLGHPRLSVNDPDPDDPDDPDENDDIYISVSCEVIPWVVRINNIEF